MGSETINYAMEIHKLNYKRTAMYLSGDTVPPEWSTEALLRFTYYGHITPKERPRKGRNSFYTPSNTEKLENDIKDKFILKVDFPIISYPIRLNLMIFDRPTEAIKVDLKKYTVLVDGALRPYIGDNDNKVKTITDALNGVAYRDDKQISTIRSERFYSQDPGFTLSIFRDGLSNNEWDQIKKFM